MKRFALLLLAALLLTGCASEAAPETTSAPEPTYIQQTLPPETTEPTQPETGPEPQPEQFWLSFAGDCTFGANPENYYAGLGFPKTVGQDYGYPFRNVVQYFANDEFTLVNLEGVLADQGYPVTKKWNFIGPTYYVNILTENSIEAVSVANNHTLDYGQRGYETTLETLNDAGVPYVERDSTTTVTTQNGLTIGLYAMVYYKLDIQDMTEKIAALKEQGVDLVIVVPHWGTERFYGTTKEQVNVGHAAIDAGADIVCGSHPHVLEPIEEYGSGVIFYSLGNFSFGGNPSPDDYDTVLIQQEVIREPDGTVHLGQTVPIPACISSVTKTNNYQPTPYAPGTPEYDRVMAKLSGSFS